jgi:hypothetical protein
MRRTVLKYCARDMQLVRFLSWWREIESGMSSISPLSADVTKMRNLRSDHHTDRPGGK